ncbi:MAG: 1-acylglycerol-3-phosphate O-acyltransferase [Alyxoria varia]|nr:MAG: 1-acylglycerol-3-phosphate O-acyltransferase [Alyxoria varia]
MFPPYCSVTAKQSLKWIPFLGWFMYLSKTVFIDRGNSQNARLAFDSAARHMKSERQSVFIFPEGTRSYSTQPDLLPFKKGAFHLAIQAQVPVVPVVVANYSEVLHLQSKVFKSGSIPVKILPPISTKNMTAADVDDLTRRTQENMLAELVSFTKATRGQQAAIAAN